MLSANQQVTISSAKAIIQDLAPHQAASLADALLDDQHHAAEIFSDLMKAGQWTPAIEAKSR